MKRFSIVFILPLLFVASCSKQINMDIPSNECSILDIRVFGQLGKPEIVRIDDTSGEVTLFINKTDDYPWSEVKVESIALSAYAGSDLGEEAVLDFYNPQRKAVIKVTSQTGKSVDWTVILKPYEAFYAGVWKVIDAKIYVDQNISGCGTGSWGTPMNGAEFGLYFAPELDNIITIEMNSEMVDGKFTGIITNDAGADGLWGEFKGVWPGEYPEDAPLDMNPRLRHLLPAGESEWVLDLTTNEMKITNRNITSTMTFETDEWSNMVFVFNLPDASQEIGGSNFYDNFWRSSYRFTYIVNPLQ
ncbi:MAG: hypothetical protein J6A22_01415 [Bacteroidales bacterium]|nr:hypothetical protein [Bacteroidales bacterium]